MSRPIRVGLIVYRDDPRAGGTLRVAETIAQHLTSEKVDGHLIVAYGGSGAISRDAKVPVHFLNAESAKDWRAWRRTRQWLCAAKFDVLHFVDAVQWIYLISIDFPVKRLDHFHGRPLLFGYSWLDRISAILHRFRSDAAIAITHGAKRGVVNAGLMPPSRLQVVYNGVDADFFRQLPTKQQARAQLGLPQDAILFGQVARLASGNACLEILDVLKKLPRSWHAVLVGDGPLKPTIEQQAKERGLTPRVHFTGALDDVRPAYAALDAVVLLSRYQPFCLMLAEAMAAGVPVFGLRGQGEYAEPEQPLVTPENSVFIPRNNPRDLESLEPESTYTRLAELMQRGWANQIETKRKIADARCWIENHFSAKKQAENCARVYQQLMNS
jgi:glycosyltransferase involved in cell wall biosynthesis